MTKGLKKIKMNSLDYSVYKDCTPLFDVIEGEPVLTGPQSRVGMRFGENSVPILPGLDNPEELVYFSSPDRSMPTPHDQFEEDLTNQGQGLELDIFPVWRPRQQEENVFLLPQDSWEDNCFQFDDVQEPFHDVLIAEEARNGHRVCQDSKSYVVGQFLTFSSPKWWNTIVRRCRTKRSGHKNTNGVVDEIPEPSHASEVQEANLQARRRRGRPRKHATPSLTQSSSSMRPKKHPDFVLPAGWTIKVVPRKNGKSAWRKDTYYIEEDTQHQCRSRAEVSRYLSMKAEVRRYLSLKANSRRREQ